MKNKIIFIIYRYILIIGLIASSYIIGVGKVYSGILGLLSFMALLIQLDHKEFNVLKEATNNDKRICKKIKDIVNVDFINFFKNHDFGNSFDSKYSDRLREVIVVSENVHYSFDDANIERKRKDLNISARKLNEALIKYTMTNEAGFQGVKIGLYNIDHNKIKKEAEEINSLADDFVSCCEEIIKICNKKSS